MMCYSALLHMLEQKGKKVDDLPLIGKNENSENVILQHFTTGEENYFLTETTQKNGWIRKGFYWQDGTYEEMYER